MSLGSNPHSLPTTRIRKGGFSIDMPEHSIFTDVLYAVQEITGVTKEDILSKTRKGEVVTARHVAIYFTYHLAGKGVNWVAMKFNRDHTLVSYAHNKVNDLRYIDREYSQLTDKVEDLLIHNARRYDT